MTTKLSEGEWEIMYTGDNEEGTFTGTWRLTKNDKGFAVERKCRDGGFDHMIGDKDLLLNDKGYYMITLLSIVRVVDY